MDEQDTQEQPVIDHPKVEGQDERDDDGDEGLGGAVANSVREAIAGEPGPADPELREKALDPAEAAVDVEDDPAANEPPNEVPAPEDRDTGDDAEVDEADQLDEDPEHDGGPDAGDPLDDVPDGTVNTIAEG